MSYLPASRADLRELWERNRSPEVHQLLWEVHRLRGYIVTTAQLLPMLKPQGGAKTIAASLAQRLGKEPAIHEEVPFLVPDLEAGGKVES